MSKRCLVYHSVAMIKGISVIVIDVLATIIIIINMGIISSMVDDGDNFRIIIIIIISNGM